LRPGLKKAEGYIIDGKRNGKWKGWHPQGENRYIRYYNNGEIEESFEYEMTN
jgi:antitoxin component YwqK of YwqJK toxin-antitoxin module